jgi:MtN3 and saliva related transmembrane protein
MNISALTVGPRAHPANRPWISRSSRLLCPFPWIIDFVGGTGAVLTTVCWLPQVLKVVREKETRALSLPATVSFTLGIMLWLMYGIAINDWPLIGSNAVTLALMAPILTLKLRYG